MPIVTTRTGEICQQAPIIFQEQRDALWAAFVTSWLDKHPEEFRQMLDQPDTPNDPTE